MENEFILPHHKYKNKIVIIIFFYYKGILIKIQILGEFLDYLYGLSYKI